MRSEHYATTLGWWLALLPGPLRMIVASAVMGLIVAALCAWLGGDPLIGLVAFAACVCIRFGEDT